MFDEALEEYSIKGSLAVFDPFIERFTRPLDPGLSAYSSSLVIDFIQRKQIVGLQPKFKWCAAFTYAALNSGNQVFIDKALSLQDDMQAALRNFLSVQCEDNIRKDYGALRTSQSLVAISLYLYTSRFDCLREIVEGYFDWIGGQDDQFFFRWSVYQSSFAYQKMMAWGAAFSQLPKMTNACDINKMVDKILLTPLSINPSFAANKSPAPLWWISQDHCASQYLAFKIKRYLLMLDYDNACARKVFLSKMTLRLLMSAVRLEGENKKNEIFEERMCQLINHFFGLPMLNSRQRVKSRDVWEVCVGLWDVPARDTDNPVSSFKDYPDRPLHHKKGSIKINFD